MGRVEELQNMLPYEIMVTEGRSDEYDDKLVKNHECQYGGPNSANKGAVPRSV